MTYSASQLELKAHLEAESLQAGHGHPVTFEDIDYWASHNIFSVAEYEHCSAASLYVDLYKEEHGIKPRWIDFSKLSTEEINAMNDEIINQEKLRRERDAARAAELKERNKIPPNCPFAGLKDMMAN